MVTFCVLKFLCRNLHSTFPGSECRTPDFVLPTRREQVGVDLYVYTVTNLKSDEVRAGVY